MTDDLDITHTIGELVNEEHELRRRLSEDLISPSDEQVRLAALEVQLDQCWDLLRQRTALRDAGADPGEATVRPAAVVESYRS